MRSAVLGQALHGREGEGLTRPRGRVRRNARGAGDEKQRKDGGNLNSLLRKHEISLVKQALSTSCATGVRSVANWRQPAPGAGRKGLCQPAGREGSNPVARENG